MKFFAPCARGLEYLLADELAALGAESTRVALAGVSFVGDLAFAYRACLWSRLASRILMPIAEFEATNEDAVYEAAQAFPWEDHLPKGRTIAVRASVNRSSINHSQFAALRVKDGVVDRCRDRLGWRPNVEPKLPDVLIDLHVAKNAGTLSLDLAGRPLHQRGYRIAAGPAPLKETLAAAVLMRGGWGEILQSGGALVDPMCGSATFLIEGAMMARDQAPQLGTPNFAFQRLAGFQADAWTPLITEARARWADGKARLVSLELHGADMSGRALQASRQNLVRANCYDEVHLHKCGVADLPDVTDVEHGLVVCNPPYGERVQTDDLLDLYRALGDTIRRHFQGWRTALLVADDGLSRATGLRAKKRYQVYNGPIECRVVVADVAAAAEVSERRPLAPEALAVRNRLQKNQKRLRKRLKRHEISCFRLYDRDLPDYAAAVDVYGRHAHVQEYAAPADVPASKASKRFDDLCTAVAEVLDVPEQHVHTKRREKQRGLQQYERRDAEAHQLTVEEGGLEFLVDLQSYLDTGLFIDHRQTRAMIRESSNGKRFLNLFAYTATASVYAAAGGASRTTSIDLSHTYCRWARQNFSLNGIDDTEQHEIIAADVMSWLDNNSLTYDLVFVDPPTWSNSKSTDRDFSVQDDHGDLLQKVWQHVAPGGSLWFSTNFKKFQLDESVTQLGTCEEVTQRTVPFDFDRARPHRCWIVHKPDSA